MSWTHLASYWNKLKIRRKFSTSVMLSLLASASMETDWNHFHNYLSLGLKFKLRVLLSQRFELRILVPNAFPLSLVLGQKYSQPKFNSSFKLDFKNLPDECDRTCRRPANGPTRGSPTDTPSGRSRSSAPTTSWELKRIMFLISFIKLKNYTISMVCRS